MDQSSPLTSSTLPKSSPPGATVSSIELDLKLCPPVFVLPTHLALDELHEVEETLAKLGAPLTYDVREAKIILGKVGTKRRAAMELRMRGLWTEEVSEVELSRLKVQAENNHRPARKRRRVESKAMVRGPEQRDTDKLEGSTTESETDAGTVSSAETATAATLPRTPSRKTASDLQCTAPSNADGSAEVIKVLKLEWLQACVQADCQVPMNDYIVYQARSVPKPATTTIQGPANEPVLQTPSPVRHAPQAVVADTPRSPSSILERAKADAEESRSKRGFSHYHVPDYKARKFAQKRLRTWDHGGERSAKRMAQLLQETTSQQDEGVDGDMPEMPDWVKKRRKYSCERCTPPNPPNETFISELKKIREVRELRGDEIGVRAYSTSIAAIAAYPFPISIAKEILVLPGCDVKIANLWIEWKNNDGVILEAKQADDDETIQVLRLFYNIWGVGASTAREFYYERGWRDLDDVVEYGWSTLTRVQQIGVKYYDQLQIPIPRAEVEAISTIIRDHAVSVRDEGIELVIVGGYRRGKAASGDVDVIVSHRSLPATANLVTDIVAALETSDYITHTLQLWLTGTQRSQATLPFRAGRVHAGRGFDTLDKALVVWQDPTWPTREADLAADPAAKNPAPRRRVDIIVSPWRTVGCAVAGWSGGTTFQRDLRRYAKNVRGWKFDSSGIRDRTTGEVVALEGSEGVSGTPEDAERTVFEGMGLVYREPWERCTG